MKVLIIGGAGFIGTNLCIELAKDLNNEITVADLDESYFSTLKSFRFSNVIFVESSFNDSTDFDKVVNSQEIVFHLASTNIPGTSNNRIPEELEANVIVTSRLLDACVRQNVKKVIFISSGGTVYGNKTIYPISEDAVTNPISSYGIQKVVIEKLLYLYRYQFGLDYRVIRLANPYGPYQRPEGKLGVVTTFIYKAITDGRIEVFGDGTVIRDFIYIEDAIKGIINISKGECEYRIFNLGTGIGTSINEVIDSIKRTISSELEVHYNNGRSVDVPINILDISRYEKFYGKLEAISLNDGIKMTADFLSKNF